MQRLRLVLFLTVLLISLLGVAAFTESRIASAQATYVTQHSRAQVTCSRDGCDGLDPVPAGCTADAYIVQTAVFSNSFVELRYSPRCGTNWGLVRSRVGPTYLVIRTQRIGGLTYTYRGGNFNYAWSAMVYAPNVRARACGGVGSISGCTAYV
jgi:hypothetical protein